MNGIFTLNKESFKSALVSTVLMAILGVLVYVVSIGDIFIIDWKALVNVGVMSLATGIVSLIKNFLTSNDGDFVGVMKIE